MTRYIIIDREKITHTRDIGESADPSFVVNSSAILSHEETEDKWKEVFEAAYVTGYNRHDWDEFKETL